MNEEDKKGLQNTSEKAERKDERPQNNHKRRHNDRRRHGNNHPNSESTNDSPQNTEPEKVGEDLPTNEFVHAEIEKKEDNNKDKTNQSVENICQPCETDTEDIDEPAEILNKEQIQSLNKGKNKEKASLVEDKDHAPVEDWEQYLDMDIRTGLSAESQKISKNIFLTRGLSNLPDPEYVHCKQYNYSSCKLPSYDWISKLDISFDYIEFPIAEVRFKNSHKDFFLLPTEGVFKVGDIVAVEANPGHDIGIISMLGLQVKRQLEHKHIKPSNVVKKLYRTARYADVEEWIATVGLEHDTMLKSRYTAWDLDLKMKVNDVEYQGDGTKAIFYYSAEERVDFRELIKILAEQFHIRIEMRQIGVRQEAARLGGLGSCGRELCCSSWLTNFQSVSTNTARTQQLSLNPQKLAGMCGKLKCCLNFEQDTYIQELKEFPQSNIQLKTKKGRGIYNKIDIFKKIVWYNYSDDSSTIFALPLDKVKSIIKMNAEGKTPETLEEFAIVNQKKVEEGNNYSMDELKHIADS